MDARKERCIEATPRYWYHVPPTMHGNVSHDSRPLPRPSDEPACIARITHDYSIIPSYHRAIALPRP